MHKLLKKDHFPTGIILGLATTILSLLLLFGIYQLLQLYQIQMVRKQSYLILLSMIPPLFAFRYYMVNLKYDKTGKGILVVSLLTMVSFFLSTLI